MQAEETVSTAGVKVWTHRVFPRWHYKGQAVYIVEVNGGFEFRSERGAHVPADFTQINFQDLLRYSKLMDIPPWISEDLLLDEGI